MSSYINIKFRNALESLPHLVLDSLQVTRELRQTSCEGPEVFAKLDVKSFYMSGLPDVLSNTSCKVFDVGERGLLEETVFWSLDHQYVCVLELPNRVWKVELGSGMGLKHSGEVADASFYTLHEMHLLPRLDEFSIKRYCRFKDDILVIGSDMQGVVEFCKFLVHSASSSAFHVHPLQNVKKPQE